MCGGYGGQPNSSTPTSVECKRRQQVNKTVHILQISIFSTKELVEEPLALVWLV